MISDGCSLEQLSWWTGFISTFSVVQTKSSSEHELSTQDPLLVSSMSPDISMNLGPEVESMEHTAIVDAFLQKVRTQVYKDVI